MLQYRFATAADLECLTLLNQQLIRDEGHRNPMSFEQLRERMAHWLETSYQAVLFEQGQQVVAYALYQADADTMYIRHFFVVREQRRSGIGRTAIQILLKEILPPGARVQLDVLVTNERGMAFWQAVGFAPYALTMEYAGAASQE